MGMTNYISEREEGLRATGGERTLPQPSYLILCYRLNFYIVTYIGHKREDGRTYKKFTIVVSYHVLGA
jgi:hypothetical protein